MKKAIPFIAIFVAMSVMCGVAVLFVRWARKSSQRAALLGLGAELLGAGMNPQPPAFVQLEEVNRQTRIKKESESGEPEG
jgi:hypothetical protein